ncbi:M4 family metallopeptidase [Vibrio sp. Of7-15]|uniref:M4 family metallopeptidase n=1 Tax=Vibrio sp. Of7-15 TaxID=2724879 RepID=UPI001EF37A78|nr:M4 family metallopeptidase [Vibrio sp. Of7-15]MCG7499454.1 M4 family metallopeptidase [Vibrio sp. Of7-15]
MHLKNKLSVIAMSVASVLALPLEAAVRTNLDQQGFVSQQSLMQSTLDQQEFIAGSAVLDAQGDAKVRVQQTYQGIPVYGESFVANQNERGMLSNFSGEFISEIQQDIASTKPNISQNEALQTLANTWQHELIQVSHPERKLVIWLDDSDVAHLAWQLSYVVYGDEPSRPTGFVDAQNGKLLESWDGLAYAKGSGPGGNGRVGRYHFGTDNPSFEVQESGGLCYLNSANVETIDMKHKKSGGSIHQFNCYENSERAVNGAYSPLNDAHAFGQVVFDMYREWYKKSPLTQKLKMRVHYDSNYENAFWDGQQMTFGDGKNTFYPLVSLDVVSHEVSHGFTQQNSNLEYRGQSGGMNEAFSDAAGAAAIYFYEGSFNWKIGDRIKKGAGAMRYMDQPSRDGRSIDHTRSYNDSLNVHYSSGIYNRAFYLLSTAPKWNIRKAFDVWVRANQLYWNARSTFDQGGVGVAKAASDLGYCVDDVVTAFSGVGVNAGSKTGQHCSGGPGNEAPVAAFTSQTNQLTVSFNNTSTDDNAVVSHYWRFGDGQTSTQQNPSHTYSTEGSYSVILEVKDAEGLSHSVSQTVSVTKGTGQCSVAAWNPTAIYLKDSQVSHKGKLYTAKWWTTGEEPGTTGQWGVWSETGVCQ